MPEWPSDLSNTQILEDWVHHGYLLLDRCYPPVRSWIDRAVPLIYHHVKASHLSLLFRLLGLSLKSVPFTITYRTWAPIHRRNVANGFLFGSLTTSFCPTASHLTRAYSYPNPIHIPSLCFPSFQIGGTSPRSDWEERLQLPPHSNWKRITSRGSYKIGLSLYQWPDEMSPSVCGRHILGVESLPLGGLDEDIPRYHHARV